MRAQRARQAVKSNKGKRCFSWNQIGTDKHSVHEAHVGVELVRCACTRCQIGSCASQGKIRLADKPLEVEDHRWVAPFRMDATRIGRGWCTVNGSREIKVSPARWWCVDMWNRYRQIAKCGRAGVVVCPDLAWQTGAQQHSSACCCSASEETPPRQAR